MHSPSDPSQGNVSGSESAEYKLSGVALRCLESPIMSPLNPQQVSPSPQKLLNQYVIATKRYLHAQHREAHSNYLWVEYRSLLFGRHESSRNC
jgi:hypothetical protein